jgi:hypothetical protein
MTERTFTQSQVDDLVQAASEQAKVEFAAECERFHNEGHKCSTCSRVDYDEADLQAAAITRTSDFEWMKFAAEQGWLELAYQEKLQAAQTEMFDMFWDAAAVLGIPSGKYTPSELINTVSARGEAKGRLEATEQCAIEAGERSPEGVSSHSMLGDMWDERIRKHADELAALADKKC